MPPEGVALASRFPPERIKQMYENLRKAGEPLGLVFNEVTWTSSSRLSLEAAEYARDQGLHDHFHDRIFHAYFTETQDIGKRDVVLHVAEEVGLDPGELDSALQEGRYSQRLEEARAEGMRLGGHSRAHLFPQRIPENRWCAIHRLFSSANYGNAKRPVGGCCESNLFRILAVSIQ